MALRTPLINLIEKQKKNKVQSLKFPLNSIRPSLTQSDPLRRDDVKPNTLLLNSCN